MLRISIDLVPHGDETKKRSLGTAKIWNDGTSLDTKIGNYKFSLLKWRGAKGIWKEGKLKNFPRKRLGAWDLLYRALGEVIGGRNKG